MPTYTYYCEHCDCIYEIFFYIKDYVEHPKCSKCKRIISRSYEHDIPTQAASIKKADSELRTIGDLAKRNSDKMSDDEKIHLYNKHNSYKYDTDNSKELPQGMNRVKKPQKTLWPGSQKKIRRKKNER